MEEFSSYRPSDDWDSQGYVEEGDITEDLSNLGMTVVAADDDDDTKKKTIAKIDDEEVPVEEVVAGLEGDKDKDKQDDDGEVAEGFDELEDLKIMEKKLLESDERYSSPVPTEEA